MLIYPRQVYFCGAGWLRTNVDTVQQSNNSLPHKIDDLTCGFHENSPSFSLHLGHQLLGNSPPCGLEVSAARHMRPCSAAAQQLKTNLSPELLFVDWLLHLIVSKL